MNGRERKEQGMLFAAASRADRLALAQLVALAIVTPDGITAEMVKDEMLARGYSDDLGNAAGSIFRGNGWRRIGFREASRPLAHARIIGVWTR